MGSRFFGYPVLLLRTRWNLVAYLRLTLVFDLLREFYPHGVHRRYDRRYGVCALQIRLAEPGVIGAIAILPGNALMPK